MFSTIVSLAAFVVSAYTLISTRILHRDKLVYAVYHHVSHAINNLENLDHSFNKATKNIKYIEGYVPCIPQSTHDDLTYDQIIELMSKLNGNDGKILLDYFHNQAELQAFISVFDKEYVTKWTVERKVNLWESVLKSQEDTLKSARKVQAAIKNKYPHLECENS